MSKKKSDTKSELKLQPLGDRVVVERDEAQEKTSGGIYIPQAAKEKPTRGTIISVGEGRALKDGSRGAMQVKVGDKVLFSTYAGETFKVGDRDLVLLREEDVLAVIG